MSTRDDISLHMAAVAEMILGRPNPQLSSKTELRYGAHGSLAVDLTKGTWYDHEACVGGGVLDLLRDRGGYSNGGALAFLEANGFSLAAPVSLAASVSPGGRPLSTPPRGALEHPNRRLVATYDYRDETGALLFQVVRYEPKDFRQRRPDPSAPGGWEWSIKGTRLVPYRLRELQAALVEARPVFIVEGERDADNLLALGVPSTCNPMGAGKWQDALTPYFSGADVVIVPDNDEPGRLHADMVGRKLSAVANQVRVLDFVKLGHNLPPKGDVSDWLSRGHGVDELYEIAERAPYWRETSPAGNILDPPARVPQESNAVVIKARPYVYRDPRTIPRRQWLYDHHFIRGYVSADIAPGGAGKTSLILVEVIAMATGRPLLGVAPTKPLTVWYFNLEDPRDEIDRRIAAILLHYDIPPEELDGRLFINGDRDDPVLIATKIRDEAVVAQPVVAALIREVKELTVDVLVVDPFVNSHAVPENDNGAVNLVAKTWVRLAEECACAVGLVHHVRKPGTGQAEFTIDDARGAGALIGAVRSARVFNVMSLDDAAKAGISDKERRFYLRVDDGKANMKPPMDRARWRKLVSVGLGNGDEGGSEDLVGVVTAWTMPGLFDGVEVADLRRVQAKIAAGDWAEDIRAGNWAGYALAEALGWPSDSAADKQRLKSVLSTWIANKVLRVDRRHDSRQGRDRARIVVGEPA